LQTIFGSSQKAIPLLFNEHLILFFDWLVSLRKIKNLFLSCIRDRTKTTSRTKKTRLSNKNFGSGSGAGVLRYLRYY